MEPIGDHVRAYNFQIEISGVAVGVAKQVLGLDAASPPEPGAGGILAARSPVEVAGVGARFGGQYYVNSTTHNIGGSQSRAPGGSLVPSQVKVIMLGVLPTDQPGSIELSQWWVRRLLRSWGAGAWRSCSATGRGASCAVIRWMAGWLVGRDRPNAGPS